jgi:hypothetical protein
MIHTYADIEEVHPPTHPSIHPPTYPPTHLPTHPHTHTHTPTHPFQIYTLGNLLLDHGSCPGIALSTLHEAKAEILKSLNSTLTALVVHLLRQAP